MSSIGEGIFIRLDDDEAKELWGYLKDTGYTQDAAGAKQYLFDSMDEEGGALFKRIEAYVKANPDAVNALLSRAGGMAKIAASFFMKKKTP